MVNHVKKKVNFLKKLIKNERAGSLIEYGLIIGFSILAFIIIIGIVMSVLNWSSTSLTSFFSFFKQ